MSSQVSADIRRANARKGGLARMQQLRERGELVAFQRNGAKAMLDKHGKVALVEKVATWRREHPSAPEREAWGIIDSIDPTLGAAYTTEHVVIISPDEAYILDIAWTQVRIALEIDGPVHEIFTSPERREYERKRDVALMMAGWTVYHLTDSDLRTDWGIEQIGKALLEVRARIEQDAGEPPDID